MLLTSLLRVYLTRSLKPFIFEGGMEEPLAYEALEDLGLYVHIPFCRSICSFCPYCKELYDRAKAEAYRDALLQEIDLVCHAGRTPQKATSLYFGGGTPALMIDDLKAVIDKLKTYFILQDGIGVELHPDDVRDEILEKLRLAGVTMVSIGVQSFDPECLRKLGRSPEDAAGKIALASTYGFEVIDADLIFAIPGQTRESLCRDVQTAFDAGATQISTYPFIDFTFADNTYKPMSQGIKRRMLKELAAYNRRIGAERTSVWTFAKPGTGKYSSVTRDTFLGFGVSATTLLKGIFKINTFSIESYIQRVLEGRLPTSLTLRFTPRQRAVYYLFWSAYGMRIDPQKFEMVVGKPLDRMYGVEMRIAEALGFLKKEQGQYVLTERAAYLYHTIEQVYTAAYIDKMWNVSRRRAFPDQIILR